MDPVIAMFLKKFFQARASVQLGMMYGKMKSFVSSFFQRISLLDTSQAKDPPIRMDTTQAQTLVTREFLSGSHKRDLLNSEAKSRFQ